MIKFKILLPKFCSILTSFTVALPFLNLGYVTLTFFKPSFTLGRASSEPQGGSGQPARGKNAGGCKASHTVRDQHRRN